MATTPQGGGIRPPDYLYEMAISRVEDLMVQAIPWKQIVAILSSENYTESADTARNWRNEVMRRWRAEDEVTRPARKDLWRARLDHLFGDLLERARSSAGASQALLFGEAIRVAKIAIVMDGLTQPAVARNDDSLAVAGMSPLEREKKIGELLAKREAARAGGN